MQINWPEIIGTMLLAAGGIGSATYAGRAAWKQFATRSIEPVESPVKRSADTGAPPGAVDWVLDITIAMGASHASCVLEALADGCCRDQARARRIEQLEASPAAHACTVAEFVAATDRWTAEPKP